MRTLTAVGPALAAFALLLGAPQAADAQQDFRWSGPLAAGQRLEVKGVHGAIRAEPAQGGEVEVIAVRRAGERGRMSDVRIERVEHAGGITFCAVYPSLNGTNRCVAGDEWNVRAEGNDSRVEFVVKVPRGVNFLGSTVNGDVHARSMPADATVSTVNGSVTVSAAGAVEASTVNGAIDAVTGRPNPGRALRFSSVNGDIKLQVPAGFSANVRASLLNGEIESDFPISVTRTGYVGKRGQGEIGSGGRALNMQTVNGNIEIRRSGGGR